jgi:hypothetical protein
VRPAPEGNDRRGCVILESGRPNAVFGLFGIVRLEGPARNAEFYAALISMS